MAELILVRHGQAQSHAKDAASYDSLSETGHEQARWLGAHFATTNGHFDRTFCGTLTRQNQTAVGMGYETRTQDPRLDEFDYFGLAYAMQEQHGVPFPESNMDFAEHAPGLLRYWQEGRIEGTKESFAAFETRVRDALAEISAPGGRFLVVTSGGVIAMALRAVLNLDLVATAQIMLFTMNSSFHRFEHLGGRMHLASFNATPHLDTPDRAHGRTFV